MTKCLRLAAVAATCASVGWAVDWKALRPHGYVSDYAGVVDSLSRRDLEQYCRHVEQVTGTRISLVTLSSLENEPLDAVAKAIFQAWGPNAPGAPDRRVMLLLAVNDRRDWVELGHDIPAAVSSGLPDRILRETRAALRKQQYGEALRAAADVIGTASAQARHVTLTAPLARRIHWSPGASIPWIMLAGAVVLLIWLTASGNPAGYGGLGGRGLIPALLNRSPLCRSTWGSRSGGGFGGFDSGDASGGFGGGSCRDW